MNENDWACVQRHFEDLCDLPEAERGERLDALALKPELRRQVEELLAFDQPDELDNIARGVGRLARGIDRSSAIGERVGPYRITDRLGEGGMGDVFMADRDDGQYEARVAVKFLAVNGKRGRALFERERRILARLDHPAIARILDAGEHPRLGAYLIMEYVEGAPIDRSASQRSMGAEEIIEWICRAADGVSYAHQSLVLRRDLKPDHLILTPSGQLKILDFGVAAIMAHDAGAAPQTGHASYTPRYAAPEQILHQATTTRTDVYALGLVLFELLNNGVSPFGEDRDRLAENKLESRSRPLPPQPGLRRRQWLDLRAIVDRSLARWPQDRYTGPGELAADLRGVLEDRPISVRRPGTIELVGRWFNRHRLAGAAFTIAGLAIIGGTSAAMLFAQNARIERNTAILEAEKAREITNFLEGIFTTATPGVDQGPDTPVRELLERGGERLSSDLTGQPEVAAYLELVIARSYMFLGMHDEAAEMLTDEHAGSAETRHERALVAARIENLRGRFAAALDRLEPLLEEPLTGNQRAQAQLRRSVALVNLDRPDEAQAAALAVIENADETAEGLDFRGSGQSMLAVLAYNRGDLEQARALFEQLLELRIRRHGELHRTTAMALFNLGGVNLALGRPADALNYHERAVDTIKAVFGVENRSVAMAYRALGINHQRLGDSAEADCYLGLALAAYEAWGGRSNPSWREAGLKLVELKIMLDQTEPAMALLSELPDSLAEEPPREQRISCRIQRLRAVLGLAPMPAEDCADSRDLSDFTLALEHYLRARLARGSDQVVFQQHSAAGRAILDRLNPAEPLLTAAYQRLEATQHPDVGLD